MLLAVFPYACSPVYRFPQPIPFSGPQYYNPYAGLRGTWQRVNLHAHGIAWAGLTNGEQASADVVRTYKALGYDVAGISNYHDIAAHDGVETIPLYEHGYNLAKRHQIAIGARRVDWFDFPLWQSLSQEQFVIERVARTADLVGLAHPDTRDAYTPDDLRRLTGYHLIEIVNGPFESMTYWDAALSSGHPVWGMANDDTHDTTEPRRTAVAWNMIDAASTTLPDLVAALRAGRAYAAARTENAPAQMDVSVIGVTVDGAGTMTVSTEGAAADIEFIGQDGVTRSTQTQVHDAHYAFQPRDTYVRAVVRSPQVSLFLNPVLRVGADGHIVAPGSTVDAVRTWLLRSVALGVMLVAIVWLRPVRRPALVQPQLNPRQTSVPGTD